MLDRFGTDRCPSCGSPYHDKCNSNTILCPKDSSCPYCAAKDAEIARLQTIEQRAGDVEGIRVYIKCERCPGDIDDPFIAYQEAKISKGKLCDIIAKSLSAYLLGK